MDEEFKKALADYYEGWELVAFLNVSVRSVIDAFSDDIEDYLDDLKEEIGYSDD